MKKIQLILIILLGITAFIYSGGNQDYVGNNTFEYKLNGFTGIQGLAAFNIEVKQSDKFSVLIIADKSMKEKLIVEVRGDNLYLGIKPFSGFNLKTPKAIITMPQLHAVELSGASEMVAAGFKSNRGFTCDLSGSSSLEIDIIGEALNFNLSGSSEVTAVVEGSDTTIKLSGSSDIKLIGKTKSLKIDANGASKGIFKDMLTGNVTAELSGSSDIYVNMNGTLNIHASGASILYYTGNVTLGEIELSGASSVKEE